jgi:hypothetical protein
MFYGKLPFVNIFILLPKVFLRRYLSEEMSIVTSAIAVVAGNKCSFNLAKQQGR